MHSSFCSLPLLVSVLCSIYCNILILLQYNNNAIDAGNNFILMLMLHTQNLYVISNLRYLSFYAVPSINYNTSMNTQLL